MQCYWMAYLESNTEKFCQSVKSLWQLNYLAIYRYITKLDYFTDSQSLILISKQQLYTLTTRILANKHFYSSRNHRKPAIFVAPCIQSCKQ